MPALFDDFLIRALVAGCGVALVAGPVGAFVVWRRMAYYGDTLAHAAMIGIALGFLLGIDLNLAILLVGTGMAGLLVALQAQQRLATDTILGIFAHTALSLGLVLLALLETVRVDLVTYLFGDVLAVAVGDLLWIYGGGAVALAGLAVIWRPLLAATVHEELARAEGVPVLLCRLALMVLIALVVAVAMRIVGVLLITSLLIIPPAAVRRWARTPEQMAVLAALAGCGAVALGLYGSWELDTPSGPSIVVAAAAIFTASTLLPARLGASS